MSIKHPIVAVTGSSGAGTTYMRRAFLHLFRREQLQPAIIEGDCFHRYDRSEMQTAAEQAEREGRHLTHFGPEGNFFDELEWLFKRYADTGCGRRRYYVHNEEQAARHHQPPGTFTAWEDLPSDTDLLFYEGLHGALIADSVNVLRYIDLCIGVVPIINLEWIQKIHRDRVVRGYTTASATRMILNRMHDYVYYITPQFSRTDINFQRVPTVDTSNPFAAEEIPGDEESFVIIHVRNVKKLQVDFRYLIEVLDGAFMSRHDTIVVPAGKKILAIEFIITPVLERLMKRRPQAE
ncbi:MAG: Phosphoribulokinase, chromosomal [Chromatiales bacterium USCg_Taylor]|nr:MAG: Phosphoribulokinase, chromosomal [Chromatiales bacterium USCg_Taylor]